MTDTGVRLPDQDFWRDRRVLVTGHSGFKGSWLTLWLTMLGARVQGLSLPGSGPREQHWDALGLSLEDEVRCDVVTADWQARAKAFGPELVIHLAAQSLVSAGYRAPLETFSTNVIGTARVLEFAEDCSQTRAVLVATTDKVYDPRQAPPHREGDFLGGVDPYSASKAAAELVVAAWPRSTTTMLAARAGNVIGGGDWSQDRLVPDLVRAWQDGRDLVLRRPEAVRPWQHVLEPLAGYLIYLQSAAARRDALPSALNFGPADDQRVSVQELVTTASHLWSELSPSSERPHFSSSSDPVPMVETTELVIDSALAERELGWRSVLGWQEALRLTLEWYVGTAASTSAADLSRAQIGRYEERLRSR